LIPSNSPFIESENGDETYLAAPLPNDITVSTATLRTSNTSATSETVLAAGTNPLLVESRLGQGAICYLALDIGGQELANWDGTNELWTKLIFHAQGDKFLISPAAQGYQSGPGQLLTRVGVLNMVEPDTLQGPIILLSLLIGYALFLGPLRLFFVKRLKKPQWWSWRIILALVAVFSFFSYTLAGYQRSASITDNSVSVIQVNQGGTTAHITTYSGIFVPAAGDFTMHIPGESLTEPVANQHLFNDPSALKKQDMPASVSIGSHNANLKLKGLEPWTLHYAVTEQDIQLHGGINAQLSLHNDKIVGTVQNTLTTSLSDLYLLLPHSFIPIGHLAVGETRSIDLPVSSLSFQPGKTLADQIATSAGLSNGYFPYTTDGRPQTDLQRHMALLSALNGAGYTLPLCDGSCKNRAIINGDNIFVTGGRVPNPNLNDYEPLLVPGAQATLIGWADQSVTDDVTINGWHPIGRHDNFVQMPLNITIDGSSHIPTDFILGRAVDSTSFDAELTLSGIYTMSVDSLTFELTVPTTHYIPIKTFTLTVPDLWANPFGVGSGGSNPSHLQALLFNWQTNTWDTVPLTAAGTFTTTNIEAYMGPAEQVLLQVANKDISMGKLYFGKPSLTLN
jgi:hypothetical protein